MKKFKKEDKLTMKLVLLGGSVCLCTKICEYVVLAVYLALIYGKWILPCA